MKPRLLFALLMLPLYASNQIPTGIRNTFRKSVSFKDLANKLHIVYKPKPSQSGAVLQSMGVKTAEMRINGAMISKGLSKNKERLMEMSADSLTEKVGDDVIDKLDLDMEILQTLKQGRDTCQLQSLCVPVESDTPLIEVFPRCVQVMRCMGNCCDSENSCDPLRVEGKRFSIAYMDYIGNDKFALNSIRNITVVEHVSCSCNDCSVTLSDMDCEAGEVVDGSCECK